jgi:Uma2 family endonuclease
MAVTPQRMTLAEFLKLPEVKPARELRHGVVSQKMPPSGEHSSIQGWFGAQVYIFGEMKGIAQAFPEARLILGADTYVPDVVVYLWDRVPEDENGRLPRFFTTPPDLVLEILSHGQTVGSLLDRCRELIGHDVRVAILADPEHMTVHVIRPGAELGPLREDDAIDITDILPDFRLTVADVLARVGPARRRS